MKMIRFAGTVRVLVPLDPNTLPPWPTEWRIYAGANAEYEALVDEEDYRHFNQWLWKPQFNRTKIYFARTETRRGNDCRSTTLYLHREICIRAHGHPPAAKRNIADHWNGFELDCTRDNLHWATKRENNRNRFGLHYRQRSLRSAASRIDHPISGQ